MTTNGLIDHSPSQPEAEPKIPGASNLVMIDNYDSFTWNVYQYLVLAGATVQVYRNDQITLEELIALKPTQLVVSPGPGHPDTDGGISKDAIKYFAGKIPVMGVCMGEQCMFSVFGGKVEITGEILHGKTSPLRHDGKGMFVGLAQDLPVTRYHSLAGTHSSLPECLEVSSWIASGPDGGKGIIMGVRHKELLVEGVQFHPESILTAEGRTMLSNFLRMKGGTWQDNEKLQSSSHVVNGITLKSAETNGTHPSTKQTQTSSGGKMSILEEVFAHRKTEVEHQKGVPSQRPSDLQAAYDMGLAPPLIPFPERIRQTPFPLALAAEVKRASPSKGDIATFICAPAQAKKYALAGASVISVLTEPKWFKGGIEDLRAVRQSLSGLPDRPAVLRKEFIFDEYQILEARLAGADTILLIVKMLTPEVLERLYRYSQGLGMEPLVEINTQPEMEIALKLGAKVIGINNRDLTNFEVDLGTTGRLMTNVPRDTTICALSGISGPEDVEIFRKGGVGAVLVGEALMRHEDTVSFVHTLMGGDLDVPTTKRSAAPMVKICGTRSADAAKTAVESGADFVGMILVEGRKRTVTTQVALEISQVVHQTPKGAFQTKTQPLENLSYGGCGYFDFTSQTFSQNDRALLVGVFQNQPLSYILQQQRLLGLDVVQLHGTEPTEWASLIPVPVIRRFGPNDSGISCKPYHALPLIDSAIGGTGQQVDITSVRRALSANSDLRVILAGGLNPDNVADILSNHQEHSDQVVAVDVSTGVETEGSQDLEKIRKFVKAAKSIS